MFFPYLFLPSCKPFRLVSFLSCNSQLNILLRSLLFTCCCSSFTPVVPLFYFVCFHHSYVLYLSPPRSVSVHSRLSVVVHLLLLLFIFTSPIFIFFYVPYISSRSLLSRSFSPSQVPVLPRSLLFTCYSFFNLPYIHLFFLRSSNNFLCLVNRLVLSYSPKVPLKLPFSFRSFLFTCCC